MEKDINEPIKSMLDRAYNKALDDFVVAIEKHQQENWISNLEYGLTFDDLESVKNELKKN